MNSKLHLCGARSWTWHWSFEKTKAARFNVSLRCITSSGFFFIVDGLVFKLSYAKKKSENLFYLVRNSMRSHDLARWDRCGKGAMNTLETNRGRNKRRRRWANWLHNKLHKQPDPESAAAIASITAMLTAQSVLWQPKNIFSFFFEAELCRAEETSETLWDLQDQGRYGDRICRNAVFDSSYDMILESSTKSWVQPQFAFRSLRKEKRSEA